MAVKMNELTITLSKQDGRHLYEQIYQYIKREIVEGRMTKGEKLPSTRALSLYLEISRSTVSLAYDQLLAEGYIEAKQGSGFFVAKLDGLYRSPQKSISIPVREEKTLKYTYVFSPTDVDMEEFPFDIWKKITRDILIDANKELFSLGNSQGDIELRESIREYLHAARGVICREEQIIVGAGNDYLLMLLSYLLEENTVFAFENPTYRKAYHTFADAGYIVKPIPLDRDGMQISALEQSGANVAYVMPSHQYPTGIVMPIGRRMELLAWAATAGNRYVIEDDYDSEFRYRGKPIPSLQSSDVQDKVIYIGTFSKSVAPAIRVSYMVLPKGLLIKYQEKSRFFSSSVSRIDQRILNTFIKDGAFERYLNRMRKVYHAKHDLLLQLLEPFRQKFVIAGENAGLHVLLTAKGKENEVELIESAAKLGVKVFPISDNLIATEKGKQRSRATVILGYAGLGEKEIRNGILLLKKAWL